MTDSTPKPLDREITIALAPREDGGRPDHSNLFHNALTRVHDIAKNGCRNQQAWLDVLEIVDAALATCRARDSQFELERGDLHHSTREDRR